MKKALLVVVLLCAAAPLRAAQDLRLWHAMSGALGVELDRLIARFNASQREYRVVSFFQGPYEAVLAHDIALRKGTPHAPHIVQVQDSATADILASGAARPAWLVMQEAGQALEGKYLASVAAYFADAEGRLIALPFTVSTPVLFYNRDAFRKAGLDPAKPPRTWYEMPNALGALAESGAGCGLTSAWPSWVLLENMSTWHNQAFATGNNGLSAADARLAFNTRLMVRWISMLASWQKAGYFSHSGRENEAEARFASGECALLTSSSASYAQLRSHAAFDVGVAQLPFYDDFDDAPHNTLAGGSALWVIGGHAASEYRGVARFFAYLASAPVQAEWHERTGYLPATVSAYELARRQGFYRSHPGHEVAVRQLMNSAVEDSKAIRLGGLRRIRGIIDEELESVWNGAKTPLEALNAAVRRGNALLEKDGQPHVRPAR